jgi:hypothetical protein
VLMAGIFPQALNFKRTKLVENHKQIVRQLSGGHSPYLYGL